MSKLADIFNVYDVAHNTQRKRILVVYFSRTNKTRRLAQKIAQATAADLFEITTTEPIFGIGGFLWCGRFGMHRWDMPINEIPTNLEDYDHVIICGPVWVFSLVSPIRAFCRKASGKIKSADLILTHDSFGVFEGAFTEAERILGIDFEHVIS